MFLISYDFHSDKTRAKFSKFLKKYGRRIQYSVFEIKNSDRVLQNILKEIKLKYQKNFTGADSVVIITVCEGCKKKVERFGYAKNDEKDVLIFN
ncbi:CRISPR-associated endonuclease Cas2 [Candidatus Campbellbacteria bacterium RIFCSPLOWO2_01_FULL_34_15]|uniref:CRISPR-associated endoribonuclease Cas2 n=1 Tax=Candidatus Campbellbacteria bacterium RIFCSPLOWO2_01_FULL_34_15 TaxID=1797579 RepID=A0A1F5EMZ5_9BACT|nr:MAG: CRISPR-associated endonuclease Cas2 [Candidatus Campbellbacteria bacterium RIFCSPLOWO2_01_FULL_34_15]